MSEVSLCPDYIIKTFASPRLCVESELLKTRNYPDKDLKIPEEFKNENHSGANSRVLRVHFLSPDGQRVMTFSIEVCNFLPRFVLP